MAAAALLCSLALLLHTSLSLHHVPMLLWSTGRSQWNPVTAVHGGQVVSAEELTALLQPLFTQNSRNLVLFLQDRLSIDDFTYFSESYGNKNPFQNVQLESFFHIVASLKLESLFLQIAHLHSSTSYIRSVGFCNLNAFQCSLMEEILQSSPSSLVLPAVDCRATSSLLKVLQESGDWKLTNVTNLNVSQLEVNASHPNLLVVQLQPLTSDLKEISTLEAIAENGQQEIYINPIVIRMFTEASLDKEVTSRIFLKAGITDVTDKIIGRVTMDLQERGINFSVIYTAVRPSRISRRTDVVAKVRRQLMATEEDESLSYPPLNVTTGNDTCILFYASNFSLKANSSVLVDLTNATFLTQNVDISASECSDSNTTLSLKYTKPVNGISSLEIRFLMTNKFYEVSARRWSTLDLVEIVQDGEKLANFSVSGISAPAEYSFHCQLVGTSNLYPVRLVPSNDEAKNWDIFISKLQIQGFNVTNNQFSYASDCTGFFTPGIWMGLLTSIILLWILTYGIHMIMQLTTNSRFDDPKGPALSVPQTE